MFTRAGVILSHSRRGFRVIYIICTHISRQRRLVPLRGGRLAGRGHAILPDGLDSDGMIMSNLNVTPSRNDRPARARCQLV